jgi:hypothetical protein
MTVTRSGPPVINSGNARWFLAALGVLAVGAVALIVILAVRGDPGDPALVPVSAAEVKQNPEPYFGREVTVQGTITTVYGRQVFTLDDVELLVVGSVAFPVLPEQPGDDPLMTGRRVQVEGTVEIFDEGHFNPELHEGLDERSLAELNQEQTALVARTLVFVDPVLPEDQP